jgi:hypothetical protein
MVVVGNQFGIQRPLPQLWTSVIRTDLASRGNGKVLSRSVQVGNVILVGLDKLIHVGGHGAQTMLEREGGRGGSL